MHEKKNTILVVDDEPEIHKTLGILLDGENYKIVESLTGKQGLRLWALTAFVVLLSIVIHGFTAPRVISRIRMLGSRM